MDKTTKTARVISDIFIPPAFNLFSFIFLSFYLNPAIAQKAAITGSSILFGVMFPIGLFVIFRKTKRVTDNDATLKEQRTLPYLMSLIFSLLGALMLHFTGSNYLAVILWIVYAIDTIGLIIINRFWKMSAHAMGASIPLALLYFLGSQLFVYLFFIVIIIGWSRLKLKVHTPAQVAAGILYGFVVTLILLKLFTGYFYVA